jgi:dienelactone hydrolase
MLSLSLASGAQAALKTQWIDYQDGKTQLSGYLVYDDAKTGIRPGVLVVHEWMGLNDYAKMRTEQLAKEGYVAFAADMYGKGIVAKDHQQAGELSGAFRGDRAAMRRRAMAGLATLRRQPQADVKRLAAIGYCFGGMTVLELARAGADVKAVVSFHGGLNSPAPAPKNIKPKILVLHGALDPHVPIDEVTGFENEMQKSNADWQLIKYGGAAHGFTNPANQGDVSKGVAYNASADARSWKAMQDLFAEVF